MTTMTLRGIDDTLAKALKDLDTFAGTWSKDDEEAFLKTTRSLESIDEEIWK